MIVHIFFEQNQQRIAIVNAVPLWYDVPYKINLPAAAGIMSTEKSYGQDGKQSREGAAV